MDPIEKTLAEALRAHLPRREKGGRIHSCSCDGWDDHFGSRHSEHVAAEQAKALAALPAPRVLDREWETGCTCDRQWVASGGGHLNDTCSNPDRSDSTDAEAAARNSLDLVNELRARAEAAEAQVQRVRDVLADPQWTARRWIDGTRMVDISAVEAALDKGSSC